MMTDSLDGTQLISLLQLADSAFPIGAFSHSYGLEAYVQAGIVYDSDSLRDFLRTRLLSGMVRFDLVFLRAAYLATQDADLDALLAMDERLSAMLTAFELREASIQVGRRFLRAALPLYGGPIADHYHDCIRQKRCSGHYVLVYALLLAEMGVPIKTAMFTYVHNFVVGQATAALKLLNLGQTRIQLLIHEMQPVVQEAVEASASYAIEDCQSFTPALEIHAMQHEYLFRRLFIS
ncbi:MAG: urease accessory protein UreF [Anaerolineae bacterium]|nr:urease accessory protein UreF [Anaerolineae bacterium]